jgi:hypothetical protein
MMRVSTPEKPTGAGDLLIQWSCGLFLVFLSAECLLLSVCSRFRYLEDPMYGLRLCWLLDVDVRHRWLPVSAAHFVRAITAGRRRKGAMG